ncbi:O-antigen ligase family protein [Entomomonas asaccharolytica]|uniref:O-antigen ligase family protein n=1 Tax=Entomomonas asaccharolytica TaxID=2785331 RepID=A0A974RXE5_9GAMM|nr:O-antigen ligase family protein [Entomomonas asaccharolytica]QQP86105.1 O-antigen ligase family protein [Entomomonas asaccharolytica]
MIISQHHLLIKTIKTTPAIWIFILLIIWAAVTVTWADNVQEFRAVKRLVYLTLFIFGYLLWALKNPKQLENTLFISSLLLTGCALIAMLLWPIRNPLIADRMAGFNTLENPIIASYAMGIAFIVIHLYTYNKNNSIKSIRFLALFTLLAFIFWTKSRGAICSLAIYLLLFSPLYFKTAKKYWLLLFTLLTCVLFVIYFNGLLLERGFSYRPSILLTSLHMVIENPLTGIGLATPYEITTSEQLVFSHSHNLFLHIGIGLGIPGLFLYLLLWAHTGWQAWKNRNTTLGKTLLGIFVFSSIALQFDGVYLWDKPNGIWLMTWLPIAISFYLATKKYSQYPQLQLNKGSYPNYG